MNRNSIDVKEGYIYQGCFGDYFSEEEQDYRCELCGTHFLEATINSYDDLLDYAFYEMFDYLGDLYNTNNSEFMSKINEDVYYYMGIYKNAMDMFIDDFSITEDEFLKEVVEYMDKRKNNNEMK